MSYLNFDKTVLVNLERSLQKEMIRTNRAGVYSSSTIVDCNTRKYHGQLVMPIPTLGDDNFVLLSSLDETVIQHGAEFNLGLHEYGENHFSPNGHKYIREFDCEVISRTTYRVGAVILQKERLLVSFEPRVLIRYTLLESGSPTTLRFRPFLAFRNVNELTHENPLANPDMNDCENGRFNRMYPGFPNLYMQFSKAVEYHHDPQWYKDIEYRKERERGYAFKEDLLVPGYFELPMKKNRLQQNIKIRNKYSRRNKDLFFEITIYPILQLYNRLLYQPILSLFPTLMKKFVLLFELFLDYF